MLTSTSTCFSTHGLMTCLATDPPRETFLSQVQSRVSHSMNAERILDKEMKPKA